MLIVGDDCGVDVREKMPSGSVQTIGKSRMVSAQVRASLCQSVLNV